MDGNVMPQCLAFLEQLTFQEPTQLVKIYIENILLERNFVVACGVPGDASADLLGLGVILEKLVLTKIGRDRAHFHKNTGIFFLSFLLPSLSERR